MNKLNIPSTVRNKLRDIVWDYTVGNGVDKDYTEADITALENRYGSPFTGYELIFVKVVWHECQMEMANP